MLENFIIVFGQFCKAKIIEIGLVHHIKIQESHTNGTCWVSREYSKT